MIRRHTRSTRFPYDALPIYKGPLRWRVNIDHKEIAYGIPEPVEQLKRRNSHHMPRISPLELLDRFWNPIRNFLVVNVHSPPQWPLVDRKSVVGKACGSRMSPDHLVQM